MNEEASSLSNKPVTSSFYEPDPWQGVNDERNRLESTEATMEAFLVADHHSDEILQSTTDQQVLEAPVRRYRSFFDDSLQNEDNEVVSTSPSVDIPSLQVYTVARNPVNVSISQEDERIVSDNEFPVANNVVVSLVPHDMWSSLKEEVHVTFNRSIAVNGTSTKSEVFEEVREAVKQRESKVNNKSKRKFFKP